MGVANLKSKNFIFVHSIQAKKTDIDRISRENNKLVMGNRYLSKMLKIYLYPAVANETLKQENLLVNPDTEVTGVAMERLADGKNPGFLSGSCISGQKSEKLGGKTPTAYVGGNLKKDISDYIKYIFKD